jgi:hypothetical protein
MLFCLVVYFSAHIVEEFIVVTPWSCWRLGSLGKGTIIFIAKRSTSAF